MFLFLDLGILPSDFHSNRIVPNFGGGNNLLMTGCCCPYALESSLTNLKKNLHITKDGFHACVDVHQFNPDEVSMKTVDNTVVVEAKHEERDDGHGVVQRHFVRKYVLPRDYDMSAIHSALSSDGVLTIKAPPPKPIACEVKMVPITHTNEAARLSSKLVDLKINGQG